MAEAGKKGPKYDLDRRDRALAYFLSHHHGYGYGMFDYSTITVPFLPLENKVDQLATPSQCFADEGAALLDFDTIKRDWAPHASRFGIRQHPLMDLCINILAKRPPTTYHDARVLFSYFAGRLGEINTRNMARLSDLDFIPVFQKDKEKSAPKTHTSPRNCFLGESEAFGEIFHFVDFGAEANSFLIRCGCKQEPSKLEIAQILVREPARISATFRNAEKYMALLRSMAEDAKTLKKHKDLWAEMKRASFLLASRELPSTSKHAGYAEDADNLDEEDLQGIREFQLCSAADAIIIDDYINYNLFKADILAAPQEEGLEDFYFALGSPLLSSLVDEAARHGPRAPDQQPAQKLQKQILERSTLFLHEQAQDIIKHDARWLEKNLEVQLVSSISLRRSLRGRNVSHTEKRTAVITAINKEYTLWITGAKPDLYQVSQALVHILLTRPKLHSAITLEMLLKTELLDLRARGFNVSRILRQKATEARLAESKRQQQLEEEQKRIEEEGKAWRASQAQIEQERRANVALGQVPGGFPNSPENRSLTAPDPATPTAINAEEVRRHGRNLFSNLSRQLGLGNNRHIQQMLGHDEPPRAITNGETADPPPPYQYDQQSGQGQTKPTGGSVTAPHQLRENLLAAIKKSRAHNSSDIFSRGETNVLQETKSYCDEHPAHDLAFVAEIKHGINCYLAPSSVSNSSQFLQQHAAGLTSFANLLRSVGEVFSVNPRTLNIFFETSGKTIGFNRNGSIFCNYRYFEQLHERTIASQGISGEAYAEAIVYWWVILCHELAHNLVGDHSSDHSYYTEGFVAQYFGRVVKLLGQTQGSAQQQLPVRGRDGEAAGTNVPLVEIR